MHSRVRIQQKAIKKFRKKYFGTQSRYFYKDDQRSDITKELRTGNQCEILSQEVHFYHINISSKFLLPIRERLRVQHKAIHEKK